MLSGCVLASAAAAAGPASADCRRPRRPLDAAAPRVVLLRLDRRFSCALQTALDPWGLRLIDSDADSPGSSMPSTSLSARAIAAELGARAVIWIGQDAAGFALWVYDAYDDRSVSRAVPEPPFDASVAASLALSVKTTLMLVGLGAEPPPSNGQLAALDTPPPRPKTEPAAPPRPAPRWQLGALGGVQLGPLAGDQRDLRYGVALRWSAPWLGARPWLELELAAGAPLAVRSPPIEGRIWDAGSALAIGVTQPLSEVWALAVSGGPALHVTALSGTAYGVHVDDLQVNPALRLGAELSADLGPFALGLEPTLEIWLRAQRYQVNAERVLDHRRRALGLALGVWVPFE